jgi:hypothetical protein
MDKRTKHSMAPPPIVVPRRSDTALDRTTLGAALATGREARWNALATYLAALPVETASHWDLCTCIVHDLAAVRAHLHQDTAAHEGG